MKGGVNWMEDEEGVSKIRLPHIYRGNNYVSNFSFTLFKVNGKYETN